MNIVELRIMLAGATVLIIAVTHVTAIYLWDRYGGRRDACVDHPRGEIEAWNLAPQGRWESWQKFANRLMQLARAGGYQRGVVPKEWHKRSKKEDGETYRQFCERSGTQILDYVRRSCERTNHA